MLYERARESYSAYLADSVLHCCEHLLARLVLALRLFLLLVGGKVERLRSHVLEFLVGIFSEHLEGKFVYVVGEVKHLVALRLDRLHLRKHLYLFYRLARRVVDFLLLLLHSVGVFLERDVLLLARGLKEQEILQNVLVHTVVGIDSVLKLDSKRIEELLVLSPVRLHHLR